MVRVTQNGILMDKRKLLSIEGKLVVQKSGPGSREVSPTPKDGDDLKGTQ